MYNTVDDYVADGAEALESSLLEDLENRHNHGRKLPKSDLRRVQLTEMVNDVQNLVQGAFNKYVDKFELYVLRNILVLPEDVRRTLEAPDGDISQRNAMLRTLLPAAGATRTTAQEEARLQKDISDLRRRLRKALGETQRLQREAKRVSQAKRDMEQLVLDTRVAVQSLDTPDGQGILQRVRVIREQHQTLTAISENAKNAARKAQAAVGSESAGDDRAGAPTPLEGQYMDARGEVETGSAADLTKLNTVLR